MMFDGTPPTAQRPFLKESLHFIPGQISTRLASVIDRLLLNDWAVWVLIGIGGIARISQYASNRSLWLDEAFLALNLTSRSYAELLSPLANHQIAPIGFLLIERFFIEMLGKSEYALRLFPLLCGLASLLLFVFVTRRILPREAANYAVALFALSDTLIYYASEAKQYSTDVAVALLLFFITLRLMEKRDALSFWSLALVGAGSVWLSHPAAFVLAGMGLSVLSHFAVRREWKKVGMTFLAIACWLISFGFEYFVFLKVPVSSQGLRGSLAPFFMAFPPHSIKDLYSYVKLFLLIFYENIGLPFMGIAAMFFFLGLAALWRQRSAGSWLTLPAILVTLGISILNLYPFRGRLVLYLMPMFVILIGAGAGLLWTRTRTTWPVIGLVAVGLLFFYPVSLASYHLARPRIKQELRQVLVAARQHLRAGDTVYVHSPACAAFQYYARELQLLPEVEVVGCTRRRVLSEYEADLDQLRGQKRVWVVFTHTDSSEGLDHKAFFLLRLRRMGKQVWEKEIANEIQKGFEQHRASASMYLFDLSESEPSLGDCPK